MLLIATHFFGNIAAIGSPQIFLYGLFIFISVYSFAELMDKSAYAPVYELGRVTMGFGLIYVQRDWFGLNQILPSGSTLMAGYLLLSFSATLLLVNFDFPRSDKGAKAGLGTQQ